jgi:hypothetical protein
MLQGCPRRSLNDIAVAYAGITRIRFKGIISAPVEGTPTEWGHERSGLRVGFHLYAPPTTLPSRGMGTVARGGIAQ